MINYKERVDKLNKSDEMSRREARRTLNDILHHPDFEFYVRVDEKLLKQIASSPNLYKDATKILDRIIRKERDEEPIRSYSARLADQAGDHIRATDYYARKHRIHDIINLIKRTGKLELATRAINRMHYRHCKVMARELDDLQFGEEIKEIKELRKVVNALKRKKVFYPTDRLAESAKLYKEAARLSHLDGLDRPSRDNKPLWGDNESLWGGQSLLRESLYSAGKSCEDGGFLRKALRYYRKSQRTYPTNINWDEKYNKEPRYWKTDRAYLRVALKLGKINLAIRKAKKWLEDPDDLISLAEKVDVDERAMKKLETNLRR